MSDTYHNRLASLRQRFQDRATAESETLQQIVLDLERGAPAAQLEREIRRITHSLAGAAGTFGFAGISARAVALEEIVLDMPDSPELVGACRTLISEIERAT